MSRILVIGGWPESLVNFRKPLLAALVQQGHHVVAMAAPADVKLIEHLAAMNVGFRPFPLKRNTIDPVADARTFVSLWRAFRLLQPDLVLAYTIKPVIWGGLAARCAGGARFCALITGLGFAFQGGTPARVALAALVTRLYRVALSTASFVVFQNHDNRDEFVRRRIVSSDRSGVVAGSGVDVEHFASAPLPPGAPVFLMVGRLLAAKGLREYAEAARRVKVRHTDVRFQLLGMPDPSPDAISTEEVQSWSWIEWLPPTLDVRPALRGCHVFVLPSYHEGMPRSVLEALAIGRPILTTDVPGCRETVMEAENGFLVPRRDISALEERLLWFIAHPNRWPEMAARSRSLAESRFDVYKVTRDLLRLLDLAPASVS